MTTGNPHAATMNNTALQGYIDRAAWMNTLCDGAFTNEAVILIAQSHQNANAKLAEAHEQIEQLRADLQNAHLRISRAFIALSPEN